MSKRGFGKSGNNAMRARWNARNEERLSKMQARREGKMKERECTDKPARRDNG